MHKRQYTTGQACLLVLLPFAVVFALAYAVEKGVGVAPAMAQGLRTTITTDTTRAPTTGPSTTTTEPTPTLVPTTIRPRPTPTTYMPPHTTWTPGGRPGITGSTRFPNGVEYTCVPKRASPGTVCYDP